MSTRNHIKVLNDIPPLPWPPQPPPLPCDCYGPGGLPRPPIPPYPF